MTQTETKRNKKLHTRLRKINRWLVANEGVDVSAGAGVGFSALLDLGKNLVCRSTPFGTIGWVSSGKIWSRLGSLVVDETDSSFFGLINVPRGSAPKIGCTGKTDRLVTASIVLFPLVLVLTVDSSVVVVEVAVAGVEVDVLELVEVFLVGRLVAVNLQ